MAVHYYYKYSTILKLNRTLCNHKNSSQ